MEPNAEKEWRETEEEGGEELTEYSPTIMYDPRYRDIGTKKIYPPLPPDDSRYRDSDD